MKLTAPLGLGAFLQSAASLLWLPQAGAIAYGVGHLTQGLTVQDMLLPAGIVFVAGLLRIALDYYGAALCHKQALDQITSIRNAALTTLGQQSPTDKERLLSGEAASLLTEQTNLLIPYLSRFGAIRLKAMLVPLCILAVIAPFSWLAPLILLFCLPPIPLFAALIGWRAKRTSEEQLVQTTSLNGFLLDRLRGLSTLRSLNAIPLTAQQFRTLAENLRYRTMQVLRVAFLTSAVLELFAALGVAFMAVYIGFHMLGELPFGAWNEKLSLSAGLFILMIAPAFFEPLRELSAIWHDKAAAQAAWEAIQKISNPRKQLLDSTHSIPIALSTAPALEIIPSNQNRISIKAGAKVALWGASGSGKTQLLSALAGLHAFEGTITIANQKLTPDNAAAYRSRTAWLGARPYFTAGSVRHNLGLHNEVPSAEQARVLLDRVGLNTIPAERIIGEDGAGLSGGEALRLAIARLYHKKDALLVLGDEPTAHLDCTTAQMITALLCDYATDKTMLIATHDAELAAAMDTVISLDGTMPSVKSENSRRRA